METTPTKRYEQALGSRTERANALSWAWWSWLGLIGLGAVGSVLVLMTIDTTAGAMGGWAWLFLVVSVIWLVVMTPVAFILRGHCLRAAWHGSPVEPNSYVQGLITIWGTLEAVWLLSLAAVASSQTLLPGALPGAIAFILLALTNPSRRALALDEES